MEIYIKLNDQIYAEFKYFYVLKNRNDFLNVGIKINIFYHLIKNMFKNNVVDEITIKENKKLFKVKNKILVSNVNGDSFIQTY
jgi:hypothetical protein